MGPSPINLIYYSSVFIISLHIAIMKNDFDVADLLIKYGAEEKIENY